MSIFKQINGTLYNFGDFPNNVMQCHRFSDDDAIITLYIGDSRIGYHSKSFKVGCPVDDFVKNVDKPNLLLDLKWDTV